MSHSPYDELESKIHRVARWLEPGTARQYGRHDYRIGRLAISEANEEVGAIIYPVDRSVVLFFALANRIEKPGLAATDPLELDECERSLRLASHEVEPGTVWRHYKGSEYQIDSLVIMTETRSVGTVYHALGHSEVPFCRAMTSFLGLIDLEGGRTPRFTPKTLT
jgi:hypothetical protein